MSETLRAEARRLGEMDLDVRAKAKWATARVSAFRMTRLRGGSGFCMAGAVRGFFEEYAHRLVMTGPYSLPSSFNVVEAFLVFSEEFGLFDLRPEREHLLVLGDYLDWYTAGGMPEAPAILRDVLEEGIVHSYNLADPANDFTIATEDSRLAVCGISMVRHGDEVSVIAILGEKPPHPSDDVVREGQDDIRRLRGHESVEPAPGLGLADRYLEDLPDHVRVMVLVRFDVAARTYDVRYVHSDLGHSYRVYTDETDILPSAADRVDGLERARLIAAQEDGLNRYRGVFSGLASMIYLPIFFMMEKHRVENIEFMTSLGADAQEKEVRQAIRKLGKDAVPMRRVLHCLQSTRGLAGSEQRIEPPSLNLEASGYWRALPPGTVGTDRSGERIVGRTWVHRQESWATESPSSVVMQRAERKIEGADVGAIYVARSPAHDQDVYKVGLTRQSTAERAAGISGATGVALPFAVLASWIVPECAKVERAAHEALSAYRVNPRREFFRAELATIIRTIQKLVDDGVGEPPATTKPRG